MGSVRIDFSANSTHGIEFDFNIEVDVDERRVGDVIVEATAAAVSAITTAVYGEQA